MRSKRPKAWLALPHRAQSLQSARAEHDAFCSGRDRLLQFLSHIPSYEPQETDGLGQVETKLNNQKVSRLGGSQQTPLWTGAWLWSWPSRLPAPASLSSRTGPPSPLPPWSLAWGLAWSGPLPPPPAQVC